MMQATKTKTKTKKLTPSKLDSEIKSFVSLCFMMLSEHSQKQIAERTTLAVGTVRYLFNGRVSHRTRVGAVQKLGYAAGLKLELTEHSAQVKLVKQ